MRRPILVIIFVTSAFLSAGLLFLVEPMMAKMMLPLLGGTPAVWNTCLVFFQAMLLAGYLYAHGTTIWLGRRAQIAVHVALILLPLLFVGILPLHLPVGWQPPTQSNPVLWIMLMLTVAVGLPFFALAANTPITQRWFADSGHKDASDPYFLYAASNAGSLAGLLSYPVLLEPFLHLSQQSHLWSYTYVAFVAATTGAAVLVWRNQSRAPISPPHNSEQRSGRSWKESLRWIALAFVPSSLMLGVTTELTTDAPTMPLFWVLPLAVYLISFVLVFARRQIISRQWLIRYLPIIILLGLYPGLYGLGISFVVLLMLYLFLLFSIAMVFHGELARTRPEVRRLTAFYLWISVGGVLGGIFNALLAPIMFHSVVEFSLVLIFAALLRPQIDAEPVSGSPAVGERRKDWLLPVALGVAMISVIALLTHFRVSVPVLFAKLLMVLFFCYSMLWCYTFSKRRLRFAAGLVVLIVAGSFYPGPLGRIRDTERSFFGVYRVTDDPSGKFRRLINGGTFHGLQSLEPGRSREPLGYYTKSGPAGQIARAIEITMPRGEWAIVGLGAGSMACLAPPNQALTYYEIDPLVARIAENQRYFTLLEQCAPQAKIELGDARLKLRDAADSKYDLIAIDAFGGDSIPIHLLTKEALALYISKSAPHGIVAFHISNRYVQLEPILGDLAHEMHLVCMIETDLALTPSEIAEGTFGSKWVVMARNQSDLGGLTTDTGPRSHWVPLGSRVEPVVWTDDYSDLLGIISWKSLLKGAN